MKIGVRGHFENHHRGNVIASLRDEVKQRVTRMIFPYGATRRVLAGPMRGMQFVVGRGIGASYALGTDAAVPRFFQERVRPGMCIYDVGANKGQMALYFASLVGRNGSVVCLEPASPEFADLQRNLLLNRLDCVRSLEVAASDRAGVATLRYNPLDPTQGKLEGVEPSYSVGAGKEFLVRTICLDDLLEASPPPDVVKIDVEGSAAAVLRGARRIISSVSPAFYIELHGPEEQQAVKGLLVGEGYSACNMSGETVSDPTAGWHSPLWCHRVRALRA